MAVGQVETSSDAIRERFGDDPKALLRTNLEAIEARIDAACARSGRARSSVRLLPVSKTVPSDVVRLAVELGLSTLGENKVQEAQGKAKDLADLGVNWSIIGHLQTNKAKAMVAFASEFQALDSLRLASLLHDHLTAAGRSLDVFVQINTSGEESKYGLAPHEADGFVQELKRFPTLRPKGLMTLAVLNGGPDEVRACFRRLRAIRDGLRKTDPGSGLDLLSMGMTGDFEIAIEEGADIVRVGQAIFGKRPTKDGHYWPGLVSGT